MCWLCPGRYPAEGPDSPENVKSTLQYSVNGAVGKPGNGGGSTPAGNRTAVIPLTCGFPAKPYAGLVFRSAHVGSAAAGEVPRNNPIAAHIPAPTMAPRVIMTVIPPLGRGAARRSVASNLTS